MELGNSTVVPVGKRYIYHRQDGRQTNIQAFARIPSECIHKVSRKSRLYVAHQDISVAHVAAPNH